jgi:2,3-bisphosphoglycerate-independent phosphoglycerate mutase
VAGGPVDPDGSPAFGETVCSQGSLGLLRGVQILSRIAELVR